MKNVKNYIWNIMYEWIIKNVGQSFAWVMKNRIDHVGLLKL